MLGLSPRNYRPRFPSEGIFFKTGSRLTGLAVLTDVKCSYLSLRLGL
jgi:hypothetical protein